jgi:hypothetical protein
MNSKLILSLFISIIFSQSLLSQKNINFRWEKMLKKYVSENGEVNYIDWKKEELELNKYIKTLESNIPEGYWTKSEKIAYWINAYNALTVHLILKNYPVQSIKKIKNPWGEKIFTSKKFSIGDIEHKILRKMNEPRIHFAINCASKSCPKLLNTAYTGRKLEKQLNDATKSFLFDSSKNMISEEHIQLSRIFLWFSKDFGPKNKKLLFISKNYGIDLKNPRISYLEYNWSLNEIIIKKSVKKN